MSATPADSAAGSLSPPGGMAGRLSLWGMILRTALGERLVYRGDFALGTLMRFLPIITQIFLWYAVFDSIGNAEGDDAATIGGFGFRDMVAYYLLTMIARQYRIIIKVKAAMDGGYNTPDDIARYVKESPYPVKKAQPLARAYSFTELDHIMERLLTADMAMKTGADVETEIDILVAELTRRR